MKSFYSAFNFEENLRICISDISSEFMRNIDEIVVVPLFRNIPRIGCWLLGLMTGRAHSSIDRWYPSHLCPVFLVLQDSRYAIIGYVDVFLQNQPDTERLMMIKL